MKTFMFISLSPSSPISLYKYFALNLSRIYLQTLYNHGYILIVVVSFLTQQPPTISGGPLIGDYEFAQIHFHWGANNAEGSENTINNNSYPLEAHAVFFQQAYGSFQEAIEHPDGLTVLAFLFQVSDIDNENYGSITEVLPQLKEPFANTAIDDFPPLEKLIAQETSVYYFYGGSLTTPPCNEAVTWIEFTNTVPLGQKQIEIFRQLKGEHGKPIHNFRPVQPLHGRTIRMNDGVYPSSSSGNVCTPYISLPLLCLLSNFRYVE
uniref:Carbonic anhydrase n=1 Tax=Photinus pyralis TaxID=7054 RepID=A0A1Y1L2Z9_PHOPY